MRFLEDNKKFNWQYSFHEIGTLDIPACVDYIKKINLVSNKIILVGHSFGASAILAGISEKIEFYSEKILTSILISPITDRQNIENITFKNFLQALSIENIISQNTNKNEALLFFDSRTVNLSNKFYNIVPLWNDMKYCMNAENIKWTETPTTYKNYFSKFPNGTSRRYIEHIKQIISCGKFVKFDKNFSFSDGIDNDIEKEYEEYSFGSFEEIPTILIYGKADKLNSYDIEKTFIIQKLNENKFFKFHEMENMGHFCFLLNNDLSWVNFLLKSMQKQITEMENEYCTLNSEDNISVTRSHNKTQNMGFGKSLQKGNAGMDYEIY